MQGQGTPDRQKGAEQQPLAQAGQPQLRLGAPEPELRGLQLQVGKRALRRLAGQAALEGEGHGQHQRGRQQIHQPPRLQLGNGATDRAGEQHPRELAREQGAEGAAELFGWREPGHERRQQVGDEAAHPQQRGADQRRWEGGCQGEKAAGEATPRRCGHQQSAPFEGVAERQQQQQPGGQAPLAHGRQQHHPCGADAPVGGHRREEGLAVVEVGHADPHRHAQPGEARQGFRRHRHKGTPSKRRRPGVVGEGSNQNCSTSSRKACRGRRPGGRFSSASMLLRLVMMPSGGWS